MSSIKELKSDKIKYKNDPIKYVEIANLLGHKFRESGRYNEALDEHLEAITICKKIKNSTINRELEAVSRRALGECYSEMSQHSEALNQHELYLRLTLQINDPIEIQRAHATIGRTYLLWGQESENEKTNCDLMKKAEYSFQKAMDLCENLRSSGKLKPREYAEMKSRLLLNLGLVYENLHDFDKCKKLIEDSITLTKANYLFDELFRCQISMGSINEKTDCQTEAIHHYEEALKTADTLKSKRKKFDVFICLGLAWMKQEQIDRAKSFLKKAYCLKINVDEDKERIVQLLKVSMAIDCDLKKLFETNDLEEKIILCDRLGDHFVLIKCFLQAIKYYKKELLFATETNKPNAFISKIYVSIGQTYLDSGKYYKAIEYFKHEYNFQLGNTCEQCTSLLKIADIQECLYVFIDDLDIDEKDKLKKEIIENYENSMQLFSDGFKMEKEKLKLYKTAIGNYLNFLKSNKLNRYRQDELKEELADLNRITIVDDDKDDDDDEIQETEITNDIYDQYDIDLLAIEIDSDGNENDEEMPENFQSKPKRNPNKSSIRNRLNQFGETPLHTACIAGNLVQVERLISQNVDINAKDFCGWTPLHEACNHGFIAIVEHLLKKGANIESCDDRSDRITPLHDACNCGHFDIIRLLLDYNANVLAQNSNNETPIECLMSWRERSKNELNKQDLDNCLELEIRMINLMKDKGFDPTKLFKRSNNNNNNNNNNDNNSKLLQTTFTKMNGSDANTSTNIIRKRNLVKDHIYSSENSDQFIHRNVNDENNMITVRDDLMAHEARQEYRNTIESIRYFGSKTKTAVSSSFQTKDHKHHHALIDENEEMPRDDWLIDDLGDKRQKQHIRKRMLGEYFDRNDTNKKLKSNTDVIQLDSDSFETNTNNNYPVVYDDDDDNENTFETFPSHLISGSSTTTIVEASTENNCSPVNSTSAIRANSANKDNHQIINRNKNRKALTVHFDDSQKSSFIVFIENDSNCRWLKEELIRRYFTHYGTKPMFSLRTDNDAILLDSDLVIDIVGDNERNIKAIIEQWTIDQPDKRYIELCTLQQTDVDKNIENSLRKSYKNLYLTFQGLYFPSKIQITLMMKALLKQNIKELDLSHTNLLANKENYNAFQTMIVSLSNLKELYLSNVSLSSSCLIHLINLNLSLRKLDLSYNPLGDDCVYSIAQIISTFRKLEHFNLSACDLTERFIQNNLLMNSIKNSTSLITFLLEYNDFPGDLNERMHELLNDGNRVHLDSNG
ncbi:tonsoku-like protein [Dermatophagoides pteronyssinus]|uniref:tonsoku-like protein n=1 Tax=Dermatophagoides pteronyssinus TaxID=6956 RepID=UPI003F663547